MTLSTDVYIHNEIDGNEVFTYCQGLVGSTPDTRIRETDVYIGNEMDQGLCALLSVDRKTGAAAQPEAETCDQSCDDDCSGTHHDPAYWVRVNFDTAYGYTGEKGENCTQLHADLIVQLGAWLDERKVSWSWRDEYTGTVYQRYEGLKEFLRGGKEASAWFSSVVMPRLAAELGGGA